MAYLRRKAVLGGLFGGDRKWLVWGGLAWGGHWLRRIFGAGEPTVRYTGDVGPGQRVVLVHEPEGPLQQRKKAKKAAKAAKKQRKAAAAEARRAS